jgi:hypothetical protein
MGVILHFKKLKTNNMKIPIHKYNGGLGATLCANCKVIITTGLTNDIYCQDCAYNKVVYFNRYRDKIIFEHIGDEVTMTGGQWLRYGYDDYNKITMVDPSGGPYISIGDNLKAFWPKGEYQDLIVDGIEIGKDLVTFKIK